MSGWAWLARVAAGGDPAGGDALTFAAEPAATAIDATSIPPEVFGLTSYVNQVGPAPRVDRRSALQVAAVRRSRDLIAGSLGTLPLVQVKPDLSVNRTSWLNQPEKDVPRSVTMTRTIADLFFEGIAWWRIVAFDWQGYPAEVERLDPRTVDVQPDGRVHVTSDGHHGTSTAWPKDSELIRFDSASGAGLLVEGARAIRQCLLLDTAAQRYADGAPPLDYFTPAEGIDPGTDDDVKAMLDSWALARKMRATGFIPAALKYNVGGWNAEQMELSAQRDHAVLEIARAAGVDPEELGVSTTSRTYANQFDRRKSFVDFTLGSYRAAIEDRLSMGDVTPRGHTVRFDLDGFLRSDAKSRFEAYEIGLRVGAIDQPEVREAEGKSPLDAPPTPQPVAAPMPAPVAEEAAA